MAQVDTDTPPWLTTAQLSALTGVAVSSIYAHHRPHLPRRKVGPATDTVSLVDLQDQRKRLQEGFMAGVFTAEEYHARVGSIEAQIEAIEHEHLSRQRAQDERQTFLDALGGLAAMVDKIPEWLDTEDPPIVNRTLQELLTAVVWQPERGRVELRWK